MLRKSIERARARTRVTAASNERQLIAEVVACFGDTILEVIHLDATSAPFSVGESPEASFKLDGALLTDPAATTMVEASDEGYVLTVPAGFEAQLAGEPRDGWALPANERVELRPGFRVVLARGEVRFCVSLVERERVIAARAPVDRPFWASFAGTATLATTALILMQSVAPDALALASDDEAAAAAFARFVHQADAVEPVEVEEREADSADTRLADSAAAKPSPSQARPSARPGGRPGKASALPSAGPRGITGLSRYGDPTAAAANAGILSILAAQDQRFLAQAGSAFGDSEADALLWANAQGLAGDGVVGSLGVNGGDRFGGTGDGVQGIVTGLIGDGVGSQDPGLGPILRHGERTGRTPVAVVKDPQTTSNVDKDVIRRIVRGHINEIRGCYNAGLNANPNLEGRVTVKFTILAQGKVASSIIESNTTRDAQVGDCIAKAVKRWKFPAVRGGGTALVSYPFVLRMR